MSKRRKTPKLPSMDDLLDGNIQTESESQSAGTSRKTPKSQDSQKSKERVKVTYYLPADLVDRIDEAHFKLNRLARGSGEKIRKYDMVRVAWELALEEFEELVEDSPIAAHLLGDS